MQVRARLRLIDAGFRHHHQSLGAGAGHRGTEHCHPPASHAGQFTHRLFDRLRMQVVACADDQVLAAAGEIQLAVVDEAQVARLVPRAVAQRPRRLRVAVVRAACGRALELHVALLVVG